MSGGVKEWPQRVEAAARKLLLCKELIDTIKRKVDDKTSSSVEPAESISAKIGRVRMSQPQAPLNE